MNYKISDFLTNEVKYHPNCGYIIARGKEGDRVIATVRGWGKINRLFKYDEKQAAEFQDAVGNFIADAINEKLEREVAE